MFYNYVIVFASPYFFFLCEFGLSAKVICFLSKELLVFLLRWSLTEEYCSFCLFDNVSHFTFIFVYYLCWMQISQLTAPLSQLLNHCDWFPNFISGLLPYYC